MAEANILNPLATSALNPDYAYVERLPELRATFMPANGIPSTRLLGARGRAIEMAWTNRSQAEIDQLRQWEAQYRNGFFTFYEIERARYYSGRFAAPLEVSPAGYNIWNAKATFIELPGCAMNAYPSNWDRDAIFIEDRDDFANLQLKFTPVIWTFLASASAHGGTSYYYSGTNGTAEWVYFGYGFRFWSMREPNLGIVEISLDGTVLTTVDLYAAAVTPAAPLFAAASNVKLGLHRVKLRVTGTKNAAATDFNVHADAIEVMQ